MRWQWQPGIVIFFHVTYIRLYKIYKASNLHQTKSQFRLDVCIGKTQSSCLLSVTGYQYAYR